ncbi:MAG: hypothetical protein AB7G28_22220 [Pirellulales bacterium]
MRFRLRTHFLLVAVVSLVSGVVYSLAHFGDPLTVVTVSDDPKTLLSADNVLGLTSAALRQAGLEPLAPQPYQHDGQGLERFLGRNALRPNDQVSVIWRAKGGRYHQYTVRLTRTSTVILASISESWL